MKQLTAKHKHSILMEYCPYTPSNSFTALAARTGGGLTQSTIQRWYQRWDGTPASLERKPVSGRPRVLSRAQAARHIRPRIRSANRNARAIHYTDILAPVRAATDKKVSLRTLQRYGKEELHVTQKQTKKRTAAERKCTYMTERRRKNSCSQVVCSLASVWLLVPIWEFVILCVVAL